MKREFKKKDRLLKYAFVYSESENDEDQFNFTKNDYMNNISLNDTIDQKQDFLSVSNNYKSQFLFKEPINKKWGLDIEHLYKVNIEIKIEILMTLTQLLENMIYQLLHFLIILTI